jgi:uncharacterized protein (UPF0261 family)
VKRIHIVGTYDTKGEELDYLAGLIAAHRLPVLRVDVSTRLNQAVKTSRPAVPSCGHRSQKRSLLKTSYSWKSC